MVSRFSRRRFVSTAATGAALAAAGSIALGAPAGATSTDRYLVNVSGLRLRTGPGTGYAVITSLAEGTEVRYLAWGGTANGYDWAKVEVVSTGRVGFVAFAFLTSVIVARPQVRVNSGPLRVRSAPGLSSSVLLSLPAGTYGRVTEKMPVTKDGYVWVNVTFSSYGVTGWVAKNFLTWV